MSAATVIPSAAQKVPFSDYLEIDAVHATLLKRVRVSPKLAHYYLTHDDPERDAKKYVIGRAAHTAVLEPMQFLREYILQPEEIKVRNGKKWDEFKLAHAHRTILTETDYRLAEAIQEAVHSDPEASALFKGGKSEVTLRWTHHRTGVLFKARLDYIGEARVDLKTCTDLSTFERDFAKYNYPLQFGLYDEGHVAVTGLAMPFVAVAVEKKPPHDVGVFEISERVLAVGRDHYEKALDVYLECKRTDVWPGKVPTRRELELPAWAMPDEADDIEWDSLTPEDQGNV